LRVRRKTDQECWYLIETRRFIRGANRGCKVRFSQGDIIDPAVEAEAGVSLWKPIRISRGREFWGDPGQTESATPGDGDSGRPEDRSSGEAKDRVAGAIWRLDRGEPDGARSEVTRTAISRCRKMSIRGNSDTDRRRYRGRKAPGQLGGFHNRHRRRM